MSRIKNRKLTRSIRFQIGFLYLILALLNIMFFSLMILEDQNDLLRGKLNQTADNIVVLLRDNLNRFPVVSRRRDDALARLKSFLAEQGADSFLLFDQDGRVFHRVEEGRFVDFDPGAEVDERIMKKTLEIGDRNSVLYKPYHAELDEDDYSLARFLLPLRTTAGDTAYLYTSIRLDEARAMLLRLYVQVGLAAAWGLVFFVLFAFIIYRFFIRRIDELTRASRRMAAGELTSRVEWDFKREDEIDEMGEAFNAMAGNIQEKIETVTELNEVINNELETGRQVQSNFLPDHGTDEEFQAVTYYRPLRAVSGDIYNFYRLGRNRRGVFLADAAGHGPSAAIITAVAYTSLDAILRETQKPEEVIGRLNNILEEKLSEEFFMTGVFLVLDGKRKCSYLNAGHPPVLVLRPSADQIFELFPTAPPLGIMPDLSFQSGRFQCAPGDRLIVYSDALFETVDEEFVPFGLPRLKDLLLRNKTLPRHRLSERILAEFQTYIAEYIDDVTFIVMDVP